MPFPFQVMTFSKKNWDVYKLINFLEKQEDQLFASFFEQLSKNINDYVCLIKDLSEDKIILENRVYLKKGGLLAYIYNCNERGEPITNAVKCIAVEDLIRLIESWQKLQEANYLIITIASVDFKYRAEGVSDFYIPDDIQAYKSDLIHQVNKFKTDYGFILDYHFFKIEPLFTDYLCKYSFDVDMWMRMALLEFRRFPDYFHRIENYLINARSQDRNNPFIAMMIAWMQAAFFEMTDDTLNMLHDIKSNDPEINAMLETAKALYYERKRIKGNHDKLILEKLKEHLLNSIGYYNKYVLNLQMLGKCYFEEDDYSNAIRILKLAIGNTEDVHEYDFKDDWTDVDQFFNHYFKRTHTTDSTLLKLKALLRNVVEKEKEIKAAQEVIESNISGSM